MKPKYNINDHVWVMRNNKPHEAIIVHIVVTRDTCTDIRISYGLWFELSTFVNCMPEDCTRYSPLDIYSTKADLIASL